MLASATADPAGTHAIAHPHEGGWSLVDRDEFGPITGRPGLFTVDVVPIALEYEALGRRLARSTSHGDPL